MAIEDRKLIVIDYAGAALTLIGCTLIVLPLIWVCSELVCIHVAYLRREQGGVTFPWASPVVLAPLCSGFFVIGMFCLWEWKGARLPIVPSTSLLLVRPSHTSIEHHITSVHIQAHHRHRSVYCHVCKVRCSDLCYDREWLTTLRMSVAWYSTPRYSICPNSSR